METVILNVSVQDARAKTSLNEIDALAKKLAGTPIKLAIDSNGIDNLNKQMLAVLNNQAKAKIEAEKTAQAHEKASVAASKAAEAQAKAKMEAEKTARASAKAQVASEKTAQAEAKAQAESAKRAQAEAKTAQAEAKTATEAERTQQAKHKAAQEEQKVLREMLKGENIEKSRALLAEQMAAAYERAALSSAEMNAHGYTPTDIQRRIENMVGLGTSTKSAAESADYFVRTYSSIGDWIGNGNRQLASGVSTMTNFVRAQEGMSKATVSATGIAQVGEQRFQQYLATVQNADGSFSNYTYSVDTATGATYRLERGVTSADKAAGALGDTVGGMITKFAKWYLIGNIVTAPIRKFKEATQELKAVNTEMVAIQKVTEMTAEAMKELADSSYDVAAAYGSTASNLVGNTAEFAKAGYGDLADELGELSVKTQVAGDVGQDIANQFLLSVDAAYEFKDTISGLNAVLDGANQIGNEYATSVEKIAEGMGIVAPIAKSAKIEVNQLAAALGTITAVTQRSGSEAARALRALILNIQGDASSEINEDTGETWSQEELDAMAISLQKFGIATETVTNGLKEMRNPMEVIGDMAQKYKEGIISEYDLNKLVADMGGKLRSNQLMALIQRWDMYEKMLDTYAHSAGSADRELEIYLDSWDAKLNTLSATWTKFIAGFGVEEFMMNMIDFGTTLVEVADSDIGYAVVKIGLLATTLTLAKSAAVSLGQTATVAAFTKQITDLAAGTTTLKAAATALTPALLSNPLFWAVSAGLVIFGLPAVIDKLTVSLEEQEEEVARLAGEYEDLNQEYNSLLNKDELTGAEKRRLEIIEAELKAKKELLRLEQQTAYEMWQADMRKMPSITMSNQYTEGARYDDESDMWITESTEGSVIEDLIQSYRDLIHAKAETAAQEDDLDVQRAETIQKIIEQTERMEGFKEAGIRLTEEEEKQLATMNALISSYNAADSAAGLLYRENIALAAANGRTAESVYSSVSALSEEATQAGLTKDAIYELAAQSVVFNNTELNVADKINALKRLATMAGITNELLSGSSRDSFAAFNAFVQEKMAGGMTQEAAIAEYWDAAINGYSKDTTKSGSPITTTTASKETAIDKLKNWLNSQEHQVFLLERNNGSADEIVEVYKSMQERIHALAEEYRAKGYSEDSEEIQQLQKLWWEYADGIEDVYSNIEKAQESLWDELADAVDDKMDAAKKRLDDYVDAIDKKIEAAKKEREEEKASLALEEKRLEVEEARQKLEEARSERTIRQLQEDGTWAWVADEGAVSDAEAALEEAKDALKEHEKQVAYDELIAQLEADKARAQAEYDAFESQWESLKKSIEKPARDIAEIMEDIADNSTPEMRDAVNAITTMLNELATWSGAEMLGAGVSDGTIGGAGGSGITYDPDVDYAALMLSSSSKEEFDKWNGYREAKMKGEGISVGGDVKAYDELFAQWQKTRGVYDHGGIAYGRGVMAKNINEAESVLSPGLTKMILTPRVNAEFSRFTDDLQTLFGIAKDSFTTRAISSTDRHDTNYFVNGVQLGQGMENMPLSKILSLLPLYTNQ